MKLCVRSAIAYQKSLISNAYIFFILQQTWKKQMSKPITDYIEISYINQFIVMFFNQPFSMKWHKNDSHPKRSKRWMFIVIKYSDSVLVFCGMSI